MKFPYIISWNDFECNASDRNHLIEFLTRSTITSKKKHREIFRCFCVLEKNRNHSQLKRYLNETITPLTSQPRPTLFASTLKILPLTGALHRVGVQTEPLLLLSLLLVNLSKR